MNGQTHIPDSYMGAKQQTVGHTMKLSTPHAASDECHTPPQVADLQAHLYFPTQGMA